MSEWYPKEGRDRLKPWKPDVCEEPGCKVRHPSHSLDGPKGPWRCAEHNAAARLTRPPPPEREPIEDTGPAPGVQVLLL